MFESISGGLLFPETGVAVVQVGGVAFRCFVSANTQSSLSGKKEATLFTYLNVREDALELYGFANREERSCFLLLIGVSGVGPAMALSVLSVFTPDSLALAIQTGDIKGICQAKKVGTKLAQRIVLDLKDKVKGQGGAATSFAVASPSAEEDEAVSALMVLGYSAQEATAAVAANRAETVEETIRLALKSLVRQG